MTKDTLYRENTDISARSVPESFDSQPVASFPVLVQMFFIINCHNVFLLPQGLKATAF